MNSDSRRGKYQARVQPYAGNPGRVYHPLRVTLTRRYYDSYARFEQPEQLLNDKNNTLMATVKERYCESGPDRA